MPPRTIMHIDMDAFFASIEMHDDPRLRGKPVIVGGTGDRGVVATASYEARTCGVHSAQPTAVARRICPAGIFLPPRMQRYREVADHILAMLHTFSPLVEPLSIDEAFLDLSGTGRLLGEPRTAARAIKQAIRDATGLTASAGIAPTKLVAKIASEQRKPDGLTLVRPDQVQSFLDPLRVTRLWGVGAATQQQLERMGIQTIGQLRRLSADQLEERLGAAGRALQQQARGIDSRPVTPHHPPKSIGQEETFNRDLTRPAQMQRELLRLAQQTARRLRAAGMRGRTVTLKLTYSDFTRITRSRTLPHAIDDGDLLYRHCRSLLTRTDAGPRPVRLLGTAVSALEPATAWQPELFGSQPRQRQLNQTMDRIHQRFGTDKLLQGTLLDASDTDTE